MLQRRFEPVLEWSMLCQASETGGASPGANRMRRVMQVLHVTENPESTG
jgi:hypothetical protein